MKPLHSTLVCLFVSMLIIEYISAQSWCPLGAEWHFNWMAMNGGGFHHYKYSHDTTFAGRNCKALATVSYNSQYWGPAIINDTSDTYFNYTYEQNDTVYFYLFDRSKWEAVYFFNAKTGDALILPNYNNTFFDSAYVMALVDTHGILQIDTHLLRFYNFHLVDSCWGMAFTGRVVERLGIMDNAIIPYWYCVTDYTYGTFRCYADSLFTQYPNAVNCFYMPSDIEKLSQQNIKLFPNPVVDKLSAELTFSASEYKIYYMNGTELKSKYLENSSDKFEVDVSDLPSGMYLSCFRNSENVVYKRFVKN